MPVIWGHVQAVTIGMGTGPRILVTACAPGPQETIDARVDRNTHITRGIQTVSLSDIKAGEFIELSYINIGDRTEARMVYLRAQEWLM
jgi:hypothetical protein